MNVKCILFSLTAIVLLVVPAAAQPQGPVKGPMDEPPRDPLLLRVGGFTLPEALEQLDLTPEQNARVQEILRDARPQQPELSQPQRQELRRRRAALEQEVKAARQRGDRQAARQAAEKLREFDQANAPSQPNVRAQLAEILTPIQLARLRYLVGPGGHFERLAAMVRQLNLTEDQRARLNEIVERTRAAVRERAEDMLDQRPGPRPPKREGQTRPVPTKPADKGPRPIIQGIQDVMDLLSPEQKAELKRLFARRAAKNLLERMLVGLDLSPKQKEQIVDIIAAERTKVPEDASPQQAHEVLKIVRNRIVSEVLTDEQKQFLAQRAKERGQEAPVP